MNRRQIPPSDWKRENLHNGTVEVRVRCPNCGRWSYLDHEIEQDGNVNPSVECPRDGCGFHESVALEGWRP